MLNLGCHSWCIFANSIDILGLIMQCRLIDLYHTWQFSSEARNSVCFGLTGCHVRHQKAGVSHASLKGERQRMPAQRSSHGNIMIILISRHHYHHYPQSPSLSLTIIITNLHHRQYHQSSSSSISPIVIIINITNRHYHHHQS